MGKRLVWLQEKGKDQETLFLAKTGSSNWG
jgi:hypothetical protein